MDQIFSNTNLTVNQLIEKIDTGELGLPELQRPFIWKDSKVWNERIWMLLVDGATVHRDSSITLKLNNGNKIRSQ